jgi:hypothetical protein
MSRIYMRVFIRNESDATLIRTHDELHPGSWTSGEWRPPDRIGPGERKGFQAEGDVFLGEATTGTEGKVQYVIAALTGGGEELVVEFDSPLIESQYGNTFHVKAPPGWEVSHWGGQGHRAELEVRVRRTARRAVPRFHPHGRALAFSNKHWSGDLPVVSVGYLWNRLWESLPGPLSDLGIDKLVDEDWLPITHADGGMCGGMVYCVMDYYARHQAPPDQASSPSSADDPLFRHIRDRLWDSFDVGGRGYRWLAYSSPHYPNGDEGVIQIAGLAKGRSWISYREEWPRIQDDLDAGRLSPVGLVRTDNLDIGSNHQVLAYAYEKSGQEVKLLVYDPNEGRAEVALGFNVAATDGEVHVWRHVEGQTGPDDSKRIWCFFRIDGYEPRDPPGGHRFTSLRSGIGAATAQRPPLSLRGALAESGGGGSATAWLRSL